MPDITYRDIDDINPADYNPRVELDPNSREWGDLERSLTEFGVVEPLVINTRTGRLVGGHQRLRVLKELGHTEVPVVEVDLDDTQEKQLNIALNKVEGRWNDPALADLLDELQDTGGDDLLELTGFHEDDIDRLLRRVDAQRAAELLEQHDGDVPQPEEIPAAERRSQPGQQTVQRNWFKIGYAVRPDDADLIVDAINTWRRRHDTPTPASALVDLCRWWSDNHPAPENDSEHDPGQEEVP